MLALPEVLARSELIRALLPVIRRLDRLPDELQVKATRALLERGEMGLAQDLFGVRARRYVERVVEWVEPRDLAVVDLLVAQSPAQMLQLLRRTRPRGVHAWSEEDEPGRLLAAAKAHAAPRRRSKAVEPYRCVLERAFDTEWQPALEAARTRIAELEGQRRGSRGA